MSSILARAPGFKPGGFPRGESGGGLLPTPLGKNLPPQPVHNPVKSPAEILADIVRMVTR